jgi:hypothetical protein
MRRVAAAAASGRRVKAAADAARLGAKRTGSRGDSSRNAPNGATKGARGAAIKGGTDTARCRTGAETRLGCEASPRVGACREISAPARADS